MILSYKKGVDFMDMFTCDQIKEVVSILVEPILQSKLFVAGGIVPWILSDRNSNRKHSDIDIVVESCNMELIRQYLKDKSYYQKEMDSRFLALNNNQVDYGIEVLINGVPVNFAPFEPNADGIIQKNFSLKALVGYDALMKATMKNIAVEDYITTYLLKSGIELGSYTLEAVKAAKENSNRTKDKIDLCEIEKIGINQDRYNRIKSSIHNMQIECIAYEQ